MKWVFFLLSIAWAAPQPTPPFRKPTSLLADRMKLDTYADLARRELKERALIMKCPKKAKDCGRSW